MVQPPPATAAQPQPANALKPLLLGCAVLFVLVVAAGGVASFFFLRAVGGAVHSAAVVAEAGKNAEDSEAQAEASAGASADPAKAGLAALGSLIGGGKANVPTLSREELKSYLPATIDGLPSATSQSSQSTVAGISGTSASATYAATTGGEPNFDVQVVDAANARGLTALADLTMGAVHEENDDGYQKTVQLGDVKVHEKWVAANKHAELFGIVAERFAISVDSNGADMSQAEQAFGSIDAGKLSSIAAASPK